MRPAGPTFWLLDGRTGWRLGSTDGVAVDSREGLRLQVDPRGPRSLTSPDGSLGRLVLPDRVAVDGSGHLFLLTAVARTDPRAGTHGDVRIGRDRAHHLWRLDPAEDAFAGLPETGCAGSGTRDLADPRAVAAHGHDLYVADRANRRVTVFDTRTLSLRGLWEGPVTPTGPASWDPVSVAVGPGGGYVLDAAGGRVHRFGDPARPPEPVRLAVERRWSRLALDRDGLLYLLASDAPRLDVFAPDGSLVRCVTDPGEVADRFDPPAVVADHRGRIRVPPSLLGPCPGIAAPERTVTWFDPTTGRPATRAADEWAGPPLFHRQGTWISEPLDSAVYRCQWHRVQTELGRLPAGSRLTVSTYTDARPLSMEEVRALPADLWSPVPDLVGPPAQGPAAEEGPQDGDAAVLSREGRYLWLRLELRGNGYDTPAVSAVRVHYPRRSHIDLLPAVYSADDTARRFLERFLSVVQTQLEPVERTIQDMPGLFDPDAAPPAMVDALSAWLAVPVERDWDVARRRTLLRTVGGTLTRRGTPDSLRRYVRAYLTAITGFDLTDDHFPHVVEGYRERNHRMLTSREPLDGRTALWGPGQVARLQLDRFATEGEVRLVTTGDPARDVFHRYAHRFRVVIPAPWVRTAADERLLRRAVEAQKPAHTSYELTLITPAIRAGRQATIGLDTVIGSTPRARLACRHDAGAAPSRPPTGRLGVDTVLSAASSLNDLRLPARVGWHARLH